jgi:hypothetical protein
MTQTRQQVLDAILARYPHDDVDALPEADARYAIVQFFFQKDIDDDPDTYWVDVTDDVEATLAACQADRDMSGFDPFLVVDLDSGTSRQLRFAVGDVDDSHDFSDAIWLDGVPDGPRSRLSGLAGTDEVT